MRLSKADKSILRGNDLEPSMSNMGVALTKGDIAIASHYPELVTDAPLPGRSICNRFPASCRALISASTAPRPVS
jgi:hypothetical protein